jgi:hypothetical protein
MKKMKRRMVDEDPRNQEQQRSDVSTKEPEK